MNFCMYKDKRMLGVVTAISCSAAKQLDIIYRFGLRIHNRCVGPELLCYQQLAE